jgi:hypothetical protein
MKSKESLAENCSYLYDEFLTNTEKFQSIAHFRRSPGGFLLMLKIFEYHFSGHDLHVEQLIRYVPSSLSSRLSLFDLIDNAVKKEILFKISSQKDHRKKAISASDTFIKEFKDWLSHFMEGRS